MLRFVLVLQACTPAGTSVVYLSRERQRMEVARWVAWQVVAGLGTVGAVVAFCVGGLNPRQKDSIPRDHDLNKQCYFLYSVTHYYYYYY
jgi:hypothetical protein